MFHKLLLKLKKERKQKMNRPGPHDRTKWVSADITRSQIMNEVRGHVDSKGDIRDAAIGAIATGLGIILSPFIAAVLGIAVADFQVMNALTSRKRENMVRELYDLVEDDSSVRSVTVSFEYYSYEKGSQGYFWLPSGNYRIEGVNR